MKPPTGITDPALASVGIRTIRLNDRPYLQCVTCQRAWLPQPLGRGPPPGWWECPNGCNAPPEPKAQAEVWMSAPPEEGAGRALGKKPTPPVDVDESAVLTLHEVADYLHCHYSTAYRLVQRETFPSFRLGGLGGSWRFLKSEVDQWIAKGGGRRPSEEPAVKPEGRARKRKPRPRSR